MESKSNSVEDAAFLLFLVPIIMSGAYAIYATITSSAFKVDTYVAVTSNPVIFIAALAAVCGGTLLEVYKSPQEARMKKLDANARRMQKLAILTLILSLIAALVSLGAAPLPIYVGTFLAGRYPILFSVLLVFLSFMTVVPIRLKGLSRSAGTNALAVILLLLAPVVYFIGSSGTIAFEIRAIVATVLLIVGLATITYTNKSLFEKGT